MSVQLTNLVYLKYLRDMKRTSQRQRAEANSMHAAGCAESQPPAVGCACKAAGAKAGTKRIIRQ